MKFTEKNILCIQLQHDYKDFLSNCFYLVCSMSFYLALLCLYMRNFLINAICLINPWENAMKYQTALR